MYLSGGVDSSLIAVLAKRCRGNEPLHTFSVGFEERDFDESPLANRVARQVGATHHALVIGETDFVAQLEHTVRQHDEPLNHAHTVQLELLSRYAKSLVTVVLTGEGSDELFGGYPRQHLPLLARRLRRLPAPLVHAIRPAAHRLGLRRLSKLLEAAASEADATVHGARFVPWPAMTALFRGVDVPQRLALYEAISRSVSDSVERVLQFDQRTYLPTLLARLDRASMASSVECRVPFLDNDVIDFSRRLPSALKIRPGLDNKIAVKRLAARLVPRDIVYRRKSGFSTPLTTWLRNPRGLGRYLDLLSGRSARVAAYLDLVAVARAVDEHRRGVQDHAEVIWSVLALELWLRHVVDRTDVARPARRAIEPSHFGQLHPALRQS
jgi:asparagine synthase (glutamine-hydrolysing)